MYDFDRTYLLQLIYRQVDELWNSMCHTAMSLISKALDAVDNAEVLLKIKGVIALFIQTMDVGAYGQVNILTKANH